MAQEARPKFNPQKHHRQSIRIEAYDYTQAGAYFVTMVTHRRNCLFGDIQNGVVMLSAFGQIADECWRAIPNHFPLVELGTYVVMPNHVHGIIVITDDGSRGTPWRAPTPQFGKSITGSIATIIGQYKSSVSRIIKQQHNITGIWQRNYYEHIIRNDRALQRITDYISANPLRWDEDDENPVRAT